jgi:hypothetical protein
MNTSPSPAEPLAGPEPAAAEEIAAFVVAAAVWAPSVHNTQPWWFRAHGREISLYADASRQLRVADPTGREMMISCGAALFTARLALRSLGYIPQTRVLPDPGQPSLVARVGWQRRADPAEYEQQLFGWVQQRRTHRGGFGPLPLAPELLTTLQAGAGRDGAQLRIITSEGSKAALAAVVETAERAIRRVRAGTGQLGVPAGQHPGRWRAGHRLPGPPGPHRPLFPRPRLRPWPRMGPAQVQLRDSIRVRWCRVPADDRS